jgi:hypothetical protein
MLKIRIKVFCGSGRGLVEGDDPILVGETE